MKLRVVSAFALSAPFVLSACEPEQPPVRPGTSPQSSRLSISDDGATLFVALTDHDEVRALNAATGETLTVVAVPGQPHRLTRLADGRVAVTSKTAGAVSVVDVLAGRTDFAVAVGSEPYGVIEVDGPSGKELIVAVAGEGDLARVSLRDQRITARVPLEEAGDDEPRGLARIGGDVIVSHYTAGRLSRVNLDSNTVVGRTSLRLPSRPFFAPNHIDQLTVVPDSAEVVVPHVECNNDPAQFGAGGGFVGVTAAVYYNSGPTGFPAVVPAVSRTDGSADVLISDDASDPFAGSFTIEPEGAVNPVINPLNRTLLQTELINEPVAVALADDGALELVVALGSGNVVVRRSFVGKGQDSIVGTVDVGVGADSIVLSPDGGTAYVWNGFQQTLTRFAVPQTTKAGNTRFGGETGTAEVGRRDRTLERYEAETFTVAAQALPADVVRGRELFHSVDQRLTQNGAIACASCHPGGADDGTTWSFAEGPRQSPPLWGGILGTEPFHWDQLVRDMADISRVTIIGRMGGSGLGRDDMNAIGAFLDQIPAPAPRQTVLDATESVSRGAAIFASAETACVDCHGGAAYTDNRAHDVGTGPGFVERETMAAFATPPLLGLAHSGPYMHDGSSRTLRDVIEQYVLTDRMGKGSHLSEQDVIDLVAFLESL